MGSSSALAPLIASNLLTSVPNQTLEMSTVCANLAKNPGRIPLLTSKVGPFSRGSSQTALEQPLTFKPGRSKHHSCYTGDPISEGVAGTRVVCCSLIPRNQRDPFRVRVHFHRIGLRNYCGSSIQRSKRSGDGGGGGIGGNELPWIASCNEKKTAATGASSNSLWEESATRYFLKKDGDTGTEVRERDMEKSRSGGRLMKPEGEIEEGSEPIDDPRWDRIKSRYARFVGKGNNSNGNRFSRQEEWGRKTWKEAARSSVPKMVGEAVYGIGPILAALTAGRREFYTLYVQEGLDLLGLSKKKKRKDKKGIERIFKMAEKLGLTMKDTSKHDLNVVVDNRPHQGLILDASPLEMAGMKQLDHISLTEGEKVPVWVALDEVTDPQNLGAILRSCYFFGVEGVVVCAKNSAPLSGVVSKASAGSLELIELRSCKNMMQFLSASVGNGWRVVGGSVSLKAQALTEVQPGIPTILVLGSEGSGLRPLVERSCTHLVKIPGGIQPEPDAFLEEDEIVEGEEMEPSSLGQVFKPFVAVESLNVSVAAGVLLYHLAGSNDGLVSGNQLNEA